MSAIVDRDLRERAARLSVAFDGDAWILGRPDLGVFVAVPEPGAVFVTTLQENGSAAEAARRASEVAGEEVDGADFLDGLTGAGLLDPPAPAEERAPSGWIEGLRQDTAARFFGRTAWSCYAAAAVFVVVVLVFVPDLRPTWKDAWFLPSAALSMLTYLLAGIAFSALHEAWHWIAGRALGIPATFRVSYRGLYIVFETDLTQIVNVPRRRRYGAYLAGMAIDAVVVAVALGLRLLDTSDVLALPATLNGFLGAVVLYRLIGIVWQWAAVPIRSDGYAVLANALRCYNLYRVTWLTAKAKLWRLSFAETAELDAAGERDRRVARWFALLYLAGVVVMAGVFVLVALPLLLALARWGLAGLSTGAIGTAAFWEALAVAAYAVTQLALPPLLALRERRLRRSGRLL
ncbi:hypothetical protein ACFFV7_03880 [Nonomuraea spiralis]|uniref:Peptide zinc metalloprotease protein n=1 Tax=Nonomuraea spiralis TaxID=46182 RepID=A0ABV5I714_9ACTN|nr:hypothetical protein [Nonomuraea spiralis]GGS67485.1 hypothetical protein GCM10010176_007770 [Nonomuraea spiralis]